MNRLDAYNRERRLNPILVEATVLGVRVDRDLLRDWDITYRMAVEEADARIRRRLNLPNLDIQKTRQLAEALDKAGLITEKRYTAKGNRSFTKDILLETIADGDMSELIVYRNAVAKAHSTFILNWLNDSADDGRVHPNWNQVRSVNDFSGGKGARTGRMSCDHPNLQNPPNEYSIEIPSGMPPMPVLRTAFLPEEGHVWIKRDFSSQEVRIVAHFEDGELLAAYTENPSLDPHEMARQIIQALTSLSFERKKVKITAFQIIYGGGPRAVSSQVGCPHQEAVDLINAYLMAMPGVRKLQRSTKHRGVMGEYIKTWGGRRYYSESPKMIEGMAREFHYKLLNYLVQGSAADQTKEVTIIWYTQHRRQPARFLAQVHDELNCSVPTHSWEDHMADLRNAMDTPLLDCPMMSEGFVGENWGDLKECS